MENIRICVFICADSSKPILERIIPVSASVSIPYSSLIDDFRFLFGKNCCVTFEFM